MCLKKSFGIIGDLSKSYFCGKMRKKIRAGKRVRAIKLDIVRIDNFYEKRTASGAWKIWGMLLYMMGET